MGKWDVSDKSDLLKELRIDQQHREDSGGARRGLWIGLAVGLVVLAAIGVGVWWFLAGNQRFEVQSAVAAAPSANGSETAVLQATGYVTARRQATVSAQITGTLIQVLIEEGDHVQEGQVIARLEDTAQRAGLAQAQAQLRSAQALLNQYQAQIAQSQRDLKRAEDLVGRKLVSEQAVEQARTQVLTQGAQVLTQQKQIELAQASVQAAQVQLDYCTVRAPFTGVVIAKAAQVGEIVSPLSAGGGFTRTGVGTIVDMDSLEVEVDVNEAYINRVVAGRPVESVLNAYPDWKIPSHVIAIIPTADRSKATVKVRIGLDTKDNRIVPDMGVRVSFLEDQKPQAQAQAAPRGVLVPAAALHKDGDKTVVFVVKD
ncbi:MAG TPA: efflux RND transporter periplasmic adaptor subunit, partial [Rudaea sp.]